MGLNNVQRGIFETGRDASVLRKHRSGGNSILEFALVIFPFFALIFGIMSVSYVVFLKGVMQHAAREGVRWAVTFNRGSYKGQDCSASQSSCVTQVMQDNSFGFLSGTNSQFIKINYYPPFRLSKAISAGELPITSTDSNYQNVTYMNQTNNVVEVTVAGYPMTWLAPLPGYLNQMLFTINTGASDVLQGYGVASNGVAYSAPPAP